MIKVGITGGIGSGKTTVCRIFEILDIPVYYADTRAKYLMTNSKEVISDIISLLGDAAYTSDGALDRKYIASVVFNDSQKLEQLNAIVHPSVGKDAMDWFERQSSPYSLKEAALLVENGSYKTLDHLISVSAPEEIRLQRVIKRDGSSREAVIARMKNQLPQYKKDEVADFIIYNDGEHSLIDQVLDIHTALLNKSCQ